MLSLYFNNDSRVFFMPRTGFYYKAQVTQKCMFPEQAHVYN